MRVALLENPAAGGPRGAGEVEATLRAAGAEVRCYEPAEAQAAASERPDRLVVAGGDGSVAAAADAAGQAGVPLALVPVGTANDLARYLGIPLELEPACRLAARGKRTQRLDLCRMDGRRPFVNAASAGLSPAAADRAAPWKRVLGPLAYPLGALTAALRERPLPCRVTCDDRQAFSGRAWQVSVSGTGAFGAGSLFGAPDPQDGLLEVTVLEAGSRLQLPLHGFRVRAGRLGGQEGVRSFRCGSAQVSAGRGARFNVDGDLVADGQGRFTVEPGAFEVVVG